MCRCALSNPKTNRHKNYRNPGHQYPLLRFDRLCDPAAHKYIIQMSCWTNAKRTSCSRRRWRRPCTTSRTCKVEGDEGKTKRITLCYYGIGIRIHETPHTILQEIYIFKCIQVRRRRRRKKVRKWEGRIFVMPTNIIKETIQKLKMTRSQVRRMRRKTSRL